MRSFTGVDFETASAGHMEDSRYFTIRFGIELTLFMFVADKLIVPIHSVFVKDLKVSMFVTRKVEHPPPPLDSYFNMETCPKILILK